MKHYFHQDGFSLIELMIVVAIIGILTAVALPTYQNYIQRARFAEVIASVEPFKIAIAIAIQEGQTFAELSSGTGNIPSSPEATKNLANLVVDNGVITALSTEAAGNATYILTPSADGSHWEVSGTCLAAHLCRS